ncbi:MAG: apolipoprotein N-acyltransferase [Candidatus Yanofskybacteria bacterium]|nr:apolipoprotein N-acyltransferase [Candidatus Yanofskybacteria bacterium]
MTKQKLILTGLAALSGLLLALAYPGWSFGSTWLTTSDLGWLAWIGFVPLFWSLFHIVSEYEHTRKRCGFLVGFAAGLIYFLIVFRWFWSIYPLDTLGIESRAISFFIILLVYLVSSTGMAMFWGLFGLVTGNCLPRSSPKAMVRGLLVTGKSKPYRLLITLPALFVLLEYALSWGFGFLWAGSGSFFGPHWTLGNLAYSLANNPLALKFASIIGIYGVTFAIIFVNYLIFTILKNKLAETRSTRAILVTRMALVVLILIALISGPKLIKQQTTKQENAGINFAVIQTAQPTRSFPNSQETLASFEEQLKLLNRVAKEYPESQLIIFPETSELFKNIALFLTPAQVQEYFNNLFTKPKLIIAGGKIIDDSQVYSRVFDLDTQNDIINHYDKRLLTPGGEFLPYPLKFLVWLFSKNTNSQFENLRELNIGGKDVSTVDFRGQFKTAPMICSELLSPNLVKQTSQNSDVIASMASYGIFHGKQVIARQMLAATRFRAAETAKPIITAANLGKSYAIDSRGNIIYLAPDSTSQILTGFVAFGTDKTWYNKVGDLPIILASLLIVISLNFLIWFREFRRP